jgi:NAD-dependent dihydropyrimidine dehydrogenase PreA subunit
MDSRRAGAVTMLGRTTASAIGRRGLSTSVSVASCEGRPSVAVRPDACMECGACQVNCPADAMDVESGVGCAAAMIAAALRGTREPTCGSR